MVLCAVFGCGTRSVRDKGISMARIPSVITTQGEEMRELSEERRNKWISAISREDLTDSILEHGRVCGKHFISGQAANLWERYDPDWVPTQNLGHKKCDSGEKLQNLEAAAKRDKRARDRELKRRVAKLSAKKQKLNESEERVMDISFDLESVMNVEPESGETGTATQTDEFEYLFRTSASRPPFDETYFANDDEKFSFGNKTTVIIDCFEVFIARPSNLMARAQTYSNYKSHNTVKILVGITPQGSISFVSNAWGGRTSDKYLTDNCGILKKLLPGDLVMADRGFTIQESLMLHKAELAIPAFTKGKDQLDPVDVEQTRGIANVRIHVERVIGLLRRKYTILSGILPIDFLQCDPTGSQEAKIPMIDRIITVCAALTNLSNGIVPLD
ncbi:unnamed protein product [Porites lobata]|uniref:THAP-type domain-containing protein n=1 Tax=Porites lobata TaxID=104759 RepID=A0ABN8PPC4_9CNID|nr:unnamed protein product [Porites lobata]